MTLDELENLAEDIEENTDLYILGDVLYLFIQEYTDVKYINHFLDNMFSSLSTIDYLRPKHWRLVIANPGYINGAYQDGKCVVTLHHPLSSGGGPLVRSITSDEARARIAASIRAIAYEQKFHGDNYAKQLVNN